MRKVCFIPVKYKKYNIELNVLDTKFCNKQDMKCNTFMLYLDKAKVENRNICKLVVKNNGDIMYCSRNVIPASTNITVNPNIDYYGHIGIFVFDKEYIKENTKYQINEDIELLKIIEEDYRISNQRR